MDKFINGKLYEQPFVKEAMKEFSEQQLKWEHKICEICKERWPKRTNKRSYEYICGQCNRDKHEIKLFSESNDMYPGIQPLCALENCHK